MKIKAAHETETFINQNGYYAIKQPAQLTDHRGDEVPVVVQLTPDQMRLLIADMNESLESAHEWFEETEQGS
jgi:hypothetical protein